ncbi:MAG: hypothetical protein ACJAX5_001524 [Patiriisocius sp.]|jgi:hypothetical protein
MKLLDGKVKSTTDEGLTEEEKAAGYVLGCVSHPTESCSLDI